MNDTTIWTEGDAAIVRLPLIDCRVPCWVAIVALDGLGSAIVMGPDQREYGVAVADLIKPRQDEFEGRLVV